MGSAPLTCGQGVAAYAELPAGLGALVAALAETLARHVSSIDVGDPAGSAEAEAYRTLAAEQRRIAGELAATAKRMESYRDLAAAPHDEAVLRSAPLQEAFAGFVAAEEALLALLQRSVDNDRQMLVALRGE